MNAPLPQGEVPLVVRIIAALVVFLVLVFLAASVVIGCVRAYETVRDFGPPPPAEVTVYYCDEDDCDRKDAP